jgi:hypothetical protein
VNSLNQQRDFSSFADDGQGIEAHEAQGFHFAPEGVDFDPGGWLAVAVVMSFELVEERFATGNETVA